MKTMKKIAQYPNLLFILLIVIISTILDFGFKIQNSAISGFISVTLAYLLAPKKNITSQTGTKTQITWLFLKKPIFID